MIIFQIRWMSRLATFESFAKSLIPPLTGIKGNVCLRDQDENLLSIFPLSNAIAGVSVHPNFALECAMPHC